MRAITDFRFHWVGAIFYLRFADTRWGALLVPGYLLPLCYLVGHILLRRSERIVIAVVAARTWWCCLWHGRIHLGSRSTCWPVVPRRAKVRGRCIAIPRPRSCVGAYIIRVWPFTVRMIGYFLRMTPRGWRSLMGWITPFMVEIIGRFIGSPGVRDCPRRWAICGRIKGDLRRP